MKTFHGKKEIKDKYLKRVTAHMDADEIIKGQYWQNGKGCAVGCTIHSNNHADYEVEMGIPVWLAYVEDRLFEGMPNEHAKQWPKRFLEAVPVDVDLDQIKRPFMIIVLENALNTVSLLDGNFKKQERAIEGVLKLYKSGIWLANEMKNAAFAAYAAANAADDADYAAAFAAYAAAYAAYAADDAAYAAYAAAYATNAAAVEANDENAYKYFADELIKLIEKCRH